MASTGHGAGPNNGRKKTGWLRALLACRRGAAALEFAFVAPLLILTMAAVIEVGEMMFVDALLEGGVRSASRYGITGYTVTGVSREDQIRQIIVQNSVGLVQPADIKIDVLTYGDFSNIGQPEPFIDGNGNGQYDTGETFTDTNGNGKWDSDMGAAGAGGPGSVVVYKVSVDWPLVTHLLDNVLGDAGRITLSASVAVRNEPWATAAAGP
ncbi:MAG: TadE/TadG family type IV pilus assembly protein [Alphaproteobacteria bacterium]